MARATSTFQTQDYGQPGSGEWQELRGELVALLPQYAPQAMGIHGIYASRQQMPVALRALLDFLVDWFAQRPDWQETCGR